MRGRGEEGEVRGRRGREAREGKVRRGEVRRGEMRRESCGGRREKGEK